MAGAWPKVSRAEAAEDASAAAEEASAAGDTVDGNVLTTAGGVEAGASTCMTRSIAGEIAGAAVGDDGTTSGTMRGFCFLLLFMDTQFRRLRCQNEKGLSSAQVFRNR